MRAIDLVIVIGWLAFWAYWLVEARNVKAGQNRWNRFVGIRVATQRKIGCCSDQIRTVTTPDLAPHPAPG